MLLFLNLGVIILKFKISKYFIIEIFLVASVVFMGIPIVPFSLVGIIFALLTPPALIIMAVLLVSIGFNYFTILRFAYFLFINKITPKIYDFLGFLLSIPFFLFYFYFFGGQESKTSLSFSDVYLELSLFLQLTISVILFIISLFFIKTKKHPADYLINKNLQ